MNSKTNHWQVANLKAIKQRLSWLLERPEGTIFYLPSGIHFVTVKKVKDRLILAALERVNLSLNWIQSAMALENPLYLLLTYAQAMMLGLIWNSQPQRIYIAGLGGGCIPLVLHHYLPEAIIECTEIDPIIIEVATKFFGLQLDERLRVIIEDGRKYLEFPKSENKYDLILIDVAFGNGYIPYSFATEEFYRVCRDRLSPQGVIVVNTLRHLGFEAENIKTLQSIFANVYICRLEIGNSILIGSNSNPLSYEEISRQAELVQEKYKFAFPFIDRALQVKTAADWPDVSLEAAEIFRDAFPPGSYFDSWLF